MLLDRKGNQDKKGKRMITRLTKVTRKGNQDRKDNQDTEGN